MEAIQSAIHVALPLLQLTCDSALSCEKAFFFIVAVFWQFLPSKHTNKVGYLSRG